MKSLLILLISATIAHAQGLALGSGTVNKAYLGSTEIKKLYLGATQIDIGGGGGVPGEPGTEGLVAWWSLDETGSPTTWVDSHSTNDYTKTGTLTSDAAGAVNGAGNASITGRLENSDISNTFHQNAFTVGGWININASNKYSTILGQHGSNTATSHWLLYSTNTQYFRLRIPNSSATNAQVEANAAANVGQWYFVVGVREADDTMSLYVDGVKQTATDTFTGTENTSPIAVSTNRFGTTIGNAKYDELFIYTKALTAAEVAWIYNSGAGRTYSDL